MAREDFEKARRDIQDVAKFSYQQASKLEPGQRSNKYWSKASSAMEMLGADDEMYRDMLGISQADFKAARLEHWNKWREQIALQRQATSTPTV